jgi:neutral ceramidase
MKNTVYTPLFRLSLKLFLSGLVSIMYVSTFAGDLRIGAAAVKITPPVGIPMAGYYYERGADKIHDDLYAKAIVIEKDSSKVAIVTCDLTAITSDIVMVARELVEKSVGIHGDNVMISATHTHTGPVIPKKDNRDNPTGKSAEILTSYISKLPGLIAESVRQANDALKPAKISFGLGHEESISFNRRFFMTDGTVGWNPGKLNPKIIKPAGPIDPDVFVLFSETNEGKPISTYVNFALHLDNTGGTEISADLPFTLSNILGKIKGPEMVTLFGQGCSGNINHINVKSREPQSSFSEAQRLGTVLSGEVIKTYTRMQPFDINNISVRRKIVNLPLAEISVNDLPKARETVAKYGKPGAAPFLDFVNSFKIIEVYNRNGKPVEAEVQVFALGDKLAIVSLPGEIFTELGTYIRSRSPFPFTIVVELTNGSIGYVPDRKAYIEGNYEPVSSRVAPGSGEILVDNALKMLNELKAK